MLDGYLVKRIDDIGQVFFPFSFFFFFLFDARQLSAYTR